MLMCILEQFQATTSNDFCNSRMERNSNYSKARFTLDPEGCLMVSKSSNINNVAGVDIPPELATIFTVEGQWDQMFLLASQLRGVPEAPSVLDLAGLN